MDISNEQKNKNIKCLKPPAQQLLLTTPKTIDSLFQEMEISS